MPKLTKRFIDGLAPGPSDLFIWDEDLPGFGIRIKPSDVRSYLIQYRNSHGRSRRLTLGQHGVLTADEARKMARQHLADVARGKDPAADRDVARQAPSVGDLRARYLTDHVSRHNKAKTIHEINRLIDKIVLPRLGHLKVAAVARNDIAQLHAAMAATPRQANHVLAILSKAFNLAEVWGVRPDSSNPCRMIKRYPETARERFMSEAELKVLGDTLARIEREGSEHPIIIHAIWLLALTGCRLNEILSLRWEFVDLAAGLLSLPDTKTGKHSHVLGAPALERLQHLPRTEDCTWVLPFGDGAKPLPDYILQKAWQRIRKAAGLETVRLHDLRHTVGTYAGQTGANAFLIRDMLRHKTLQMTDRYVNRNGPIITAF
jgi:integrase